MRAAIIEEFVDKDSKLVIKIVKDKTQDFVFRVKGNKKMKRFINRTFVRNQGLSSFAEKIGISLENGETKSVKVSKVLKAIKTLQNLKG